MFRNLSFLLPNEGTTNTLEEKSQELVEFVKQLAVGDKQRKNLEEMIEETLFWLGEKKVEEEN